MAEDASQIRQAIEETRADIAVTMEALGQKADVKERLSEQVKEKTGELKTTAAASVEQVRAKLGTVQEQALAALPESAQPTADAALAKAREVAGTVAGDPSRQRTVAVAAGFVLLMILVRRRRRRRV
ncbi:MAG TPA: DUF3618 domain-containing protein [Acidimicrobiales bacterium]|nr:DUF3618 domain-containing protein [Acidimicrobiales bacterium]